MNLINYPAGPGDNFHTVAKNAKFLTTKDTNVKFEFNDIVCIVSTTTDLELLYRDYANAWLMEWKIVGPGCLPEYPDKVRAELERRTKAQEEKRKIQEEESNRKDVQEKANFQLKTDGISIDLIDQKAWDDWKAKNTDSYGAGIFEYAESWARLMQVEMAKGKSIPECAETTSFELGFLGITGFMYGAAVSILSNCWKHGEALKTWHNAQYNHKGEEVANPAILTIG